MRRRPPRSTLFPYTALFRSEKAARGMRHVKRAVRGDLHRFKAFIEMQEVETGAWRGVIEDGELVEEHDESYDEERDYRALEDIHEQAGGETEEEERGETEEEEEEDTQQARTERFKRQAQRAGEKPARAPAASRRSGASASSSSPSGSSKTRSSSKPSGGTRSQGRTRGAGNGGGSP